MNAQVILVDVNAKMVAAWRDVFEDNPEVIVVHGSMIDQATSAWVSPTNSKGMMDGGLDGVIRKYLGPQIQTKVQSEIARLYQGAMPLGHTTCVSTGAPRPEWLISTPTMLGRSDDVSDTLNVALACAAALQRVRMQNRQSPGSIGSVAMPGLGANTGKVPVEICADLMWTAYYLVTTRDFESFSEMRRALEIELGILGNPRPAMQKTPASNGVKGPLFPPKAQVIPLNSVIFQPGASGGVVPKPKPIVDFDDTE